MSIHDYLDSIKSRLLTDDIIASFHIIRERETLTDGHLRARLALIDGTFLEFSEYIQSSPEDTVHIVTYSCHWANANGKLIRRWDNAPHFPELFGFPHHIHDGVTNAVNPGTAMSIFMVLDEIAQSL